MHPSGRNLRRSVDINNNVVFLPVVGEREDFVGDFVPVERDAADVLSGGGGETFTSRTADLNIIAV